MYNVDNKKSRRTIILAGCALLLVALQLLTIAMVNVVQKIEPTTNPYAQDMSFSPISESDVSETDAEEQKVVIIPMIINANSPISADYVPENLVKIGGEVKGKESIQMNATAFKAYKLMYADIIKAGIPAPILISGYRSYEYQKTLYDRKVAEYGPGQSVTAAPGTSEHQYSSTCDLSTDGTCQNDFGETKVGKWIAENGHLYGYIIRYPNSKKEYTGINFEPWHLRYVGVEHATAMFEMNMCLEEYVEYLREKYPDAQTESSPDQFPAPRFAGDLEGETEGSTAAGYKYEKLIKRYLDYEDSVKKSDEAVLSFVGDCTLGTWPEASKENNYNTIYERSGSKTYSFDIVSPFFKHDDYTYVNLETTLTTSTHKIENKAYNFKGDMAWAKDMLAASGVDGCNVANNHCYDWGEQSYADTVSCVREAGMDIGDEDNVIARRMGGVEVVLLSCNYIANGNYTYTTGRVKQYGDELTNSMIDQIKKYKREDNIVIICCHWGIEREQIPTADQTSPAHKFIDAGADMVVGHHPHTVQGVELYNDKYIFYSIGNFAFGGKGTTDEINRISLMLRPRFALRDGKAGLTGLLIVPCYTTSSDDIGINNYQPRPLYGDEAKALLEKTISLSGKLSGGVKELEFPTVDYSLG